MEVERVTGHGVVVSCSALRRAYRDCLRKEVHGILAQIRDGKKVDHHETVRISKDGRRIDVSLSISPVKSSKGTIIGAAKVARGKVHVIRLAFYM